MAPTAQKRILPDLSQSSKDDGVAGLDPLPEMDAEFRDDLFPGAVDPDLKRVS